MKNAKIGQINNPTTPLTNFYRQPSFLFLIPLPFFIYHLATNIIIILSSYGLIVS